MSPEEKERLRNERARARAEKIAREAELAANKRSAKRRAKIQKKAAKETQLKHKIPRKCRPQLVSYIQKVKYSEDDLRQFLIQYCQKYSVETLSRSCGRIDSENVFLAAVFHCQPLKLKVLIEILGPEHARDFCKSGRTKAGGTILHLATDVTLRNSPQVRLDTVKILFALLGHDIEELSKVMMYVETEFNVDDNPELSESMRFKSKKRPQKGIKIDEINARMFAQKTDSDEHKEILDIFMSSKTYRMNHPDIELNYVDHRAAAGPANDYTSQNAESNIQGSDQIESGSPISLPAPPSYENLIGVDEDKPGSDSSNKKQSSTGSTSSAGSQSDSDEDTDSDSSKVLSLNESCDVGQTIHEDEKKQKIARLIQEKEEVLLRMGVQLKRNAILRRQLARLQEIEYQMCASTASVVDQGLENQIISDSSKMAMAAEAQERIDLGNDQTHPLDQYLARIGEEQSELPVVVPAVGTIIPLTAGNALNNKLNNDQDPHSVLPVHTPTGDCSADNFGVEDGQPSNFNNSFVLFASRPQSPSVADPQSSTTPEFFAEEVLNNPNAGHLPSDLFSNTLDNQTVNRGTERFDTTSIHGSKQRLSLLRFLIMLIHSSIRSENVRTAAASEKNGGLNCLQNVQTSDAGAAGQSDEQSGERSAINISTRLGWDLD